MNPNILIQVNIFVGRGDAYIIESPKLLITMKCYDSTVHEKVQLSGDVPFLYIYI